MPSHAPNDPNFKHTEVLQGVIQKLIISADQRRPKPLQMTGFEFGPSVAPRLGAMYFDFTNVPNHTAAASARPIGLNRGIGSHEQA